MSASKLIKKAMIQKGIKTGELAKMIGIDTQQLSNKLYRDVMAFTAAENIAGALNYNVVLEDRETGEIIR